jgi:hypothetical protein
VRLEGGVEVSACPEEIGLSNAMISMARAKPTNLGSVNVPPPSLDLVIEIGDKVLDEFSLCLGSAIAGVSIP